MNQILLAEFVKKYGFTSKLVRAVCRANGWRYTAMGAPAEWYAAWPVIGVELERLAHGLHRGWYE